jgi:uncharacterized membrane protein HdeD (DUF308 family)
MKNESKNDRIIRAIVGIILFLIAYTFLSGVLQVVVYVLAVVAIVTAVTGFCLLYKFFGIDTNKK